MKKIVFIFVLICFFSCENEGETVVVNGDLAHVALDTVTNMNAEEIKLKKIEERLYHITIYDYKEEKDTIVNFNFLESDGSLNFTFDYKPFDKRFHSDSISLLTENIEVVIVKSKFDKSNSRLTYDSDSLNIIGIDGHNVIGAEEIPNTYISKMYLNMSGNYFEIDKEYYEDLYEPNFNLTEAYYYDKEIIITMSNSDGYLGYGVTFFLNNELNIKRIVNIP